MPTPSFFDMFGVTLLSGDDPKQALTDLNNIYLSESAARRIFGDEDPVGEIMTRQEGLFPGGRSIQRFSQKQPHRIRRRFGLRQRRTVRW